MIKCWNTYRDIWFNDGSADMSPAATSMVAEIAAYLKQNPSLQVGLDSSTKFYRADESSSDLGNRRCKAVHDALVAAGVPAASIRIGAFGKPSEPRDRRVEVLIETDMGQ